MQWRTDRGCRIIASTSRSETLILLQSHLTFRSCFSSSQKCQVNMAVLSLSLTLSLSVSTSERQPRLRSLALKSSRLKHASMNEVTFSPSLHDVNLQCRQPSPDHHNLNIHHGDEGEDVHGHRSLPLLRPDNQQACKLPRHPSSLFASLLPCILSGFQGSTPPRGETTYRCRYISTYN